MNNNLIKKSCIIFLSFFIFPCVFSQNLNESKSIYKWFDSNVGVENTGIYNGVEYQKKYRTLEGSSEFYLTPQFVIGNIIYDEQPYYDIEMKYDIYEDELIIKLFTQSTFNIIQLIKEKVESFSINNKHFVRFSNNEKEGFYELLFDGDYFTLYTKHKKLRSERLDKGYAYNVFRDKKEYLIKYNQKYHTIKSKADFLKLFPEHKKYIKSFYKINKALRRIDYEVFLNELLKDLESLILNNELSN